MASESLQRKVIVIGLDEADPILLEKWSQDGSLPRVRALMNRCIAGRGIEPVSVMDLGATVADWLGVAVPDADGASIARALSAHS